MTGSKVLFYVSALAVNILFFVSGYMNVMRDFLPIIYILFACFSILSFFAFRKASVYIYLFIFIQIAMLLQINIISFLHGEIELLEFSTVIFVVHCIYIFLPTLVISILSFFLAKWLFGKPRDVK